MRAWLVVLLLATGACAPDLPRSYTCVSTSQCVLGGIAGVCEPTGACSFPDTGCSGGRRYGDLGPPALAGTCIGTSSGADGGSDGNGGSDGGSGAIARIATSTLPAAAPTGGAATLSTPAQLTAGDLLFACVFADASGATVTAPPGWTLHVALDNASGGNFHVAWFFKVAGASEPASYAFPVGGQPGMVAAALAVYRGVDGNAAIDDATNRTFVAAAFTAPSITTRHPGDLLLAMFVDATGSSLTWNPPAGMQSAVDMPVIGFFDATQPTAGATGPRTATLSFGGVPGVGGVDFVALAPAP